jgi:hypothetical protein
MRIGIVILAMLAPRRTATLCLLGVPVMLGVLGLTLSPLLVGHIEAIFHDAAVNAASEALHHPSIMSWVIFVEAGARWMLALAGAALCVIIHR